MNVLSGSAVVYTAFVRVRDQEGAGSAQIVTRIPDANAVCAKIVGIPAVKPGDPNGAVQVHRLREGTHDMLVPPPVRGGPVSSVITVYDVARGEWGVVSVGRGKIVAGI